MASQDFEPSQSSLFAASTTSVPLWRAAEAVEARPLGADVRLTEGERVSSDSVPYARSITESVPLWRTSDGTLDPSTSDAAETESIAHAKALAAQTREAFAKIPASEATFAPRIVSSDDFGTYEAASDVVNAHNIRETPEDVAPKSAEVAKRAERRTAMLCMESEAVQQAEEPLDHAKETIDAVDATVRRKGKEMVNSAAQVAGGVAASVSEKGHQAAESINNAASIVAKEALSAYLVSP